jgi:putative tryptophan/tyrosine transport system substrate-binding protein
VLPQSNRIAVLFNPSNTISPAILETMGLTAASLKLVLYHFQVRRLDELERSFSNMNATRVDAIVVVEDPFVVGATELIGQLVMAHRLPAIGFLELAAAGGLIAYAVDFVEMSRHAATFVDKIIRGAKPYQLPIEEPHKFKLVINLKTAQTFGLNLPSTFAARADEVIE